MFRKASSSDTLFHPDRLLALANSATSSLTTDDGTSIRDLVSLTERLRGNDAAKIHFATIPVRELSATDSGAFKDANGFWELRGVGSVLMYDHCGAGRFLRSVASTVGATSIALCPVQPGPDRR